MLIYKGCPTTTASEKIASFPKNIGGRVGNETHAINIVVFSFGLKMGSHYNILIRYDQYMVSHANILSISNGTIDV